MGLDRLLGRNTKVRHAWALIELLWQRTQSLSLYPSSYSDAGTLALDGDPFNSPHTALSWPPCLAPAPPSNGEGLSGLASAHLGGGPGVDQLLQRFFIIL